MCSKRQDGEEDASDLVEEAAGEKKTIMKMNSSTSMDELDVDMVRRSPLPRPPRRPALTPPRSSWSTHRSPRRA